jgi:hypothetical protein
MTMTKTTFAFIGFLALGSNAAQANPPGENCHRRFQTALTETFTGGGNEGAWSLSGGGIVESRGGRSDEFLHEDYVDTFAPWGQTEWGVASMFTGNYRAQDVIALAAEFRIFSVSVTVAERPMSLVLVSDPGTPLDPTDDLFVSYVGPENIPMPGGWHSYEFDVPSDSPVLPFPRSQIEGEPGWVATRGDMFTPVRDPDAAWNAVIEDVDQVIFWFHDPRYFAIIQSWNVGMDNPSLITCSETLASP